MEWKLIGSGNVPTGFENVQIDENNLSEHREILRALALKAVEDGTIKLCKKGDGTQPKHETEHHVYIPYHESKEYLEQQKKEKEWEEQNKKEWEEKFLKDESKKEEFEKEGITPLMAIAMRGTVEGCKKLISEGASIDKMSKVLEPKIPTLEDGDYENYEEDETRHFNLMFFIGNISGISVTSGCTALMLAAIVGEVENLKLLISEGADISKETPAECGNAGRTALHFAAKCGHFEICKLLVAAGADVDKESAWGFTPLMYAAKINHFDICKLLVSAGADIHKENKMGWTPLMLTGSGKPNWETAKIFIAKGADVKKKNKDGLDLFMIALNSQESSGISDFCSSLALLEPDVLKNAILDTNALAKAADKRCWDIHEIFILLGADVDKEDKDGWTSLMKAAHDADWNTSTCELLISAGANIDKEVLLDKEPTTALMLAVKEEHTSTAKLLLKAGANTDKIPKEKLEMLKEKSDGFNSPTNSNEDTTSAEDKDKEKAPIYVNCENIDQAEALAEACDLKINKSDDNAMTSLFEKCKCLISAGANFDALALMNAAAHGYSEICKMLIAAGVDVNQTADFGSTALIKAAELGHTEICQMLIAAGAKIEHEAMYRETALSLAMKNHHIKTCRALIAAGASIHVPDYYATALQYAAGTNMTEICELLLTSMCANIDEEDKEGRTALMKAAEGGAAEACRFLISKGASIEKEDKDGNTALMKASWNDNEYIDVYKELISSGANVDKQDSNGLTVLMKTHNPEICKLFISAGANINFQDSKGQTALMKTMVWNGSSKNKTEKPEICKLLISAGADLNLEDSNGETALMKAAKDCLVNTCKTLIAAGADVKMEISEKNEVRGYTALHFAAQPARYKYHYKEIVEIVKMLISAGANIDHESAEGWTPLMVAAKEEKSWEICRELILRGADINKESKDGWTPLLITINKHHENCQGDEEEVCTMLIKLGADLKETMPNGSPVLSCAASNMFLYNVCAILLQRGADVNKEDENGWTPLMKAACEEHNIHMCKLLIAYGANVDKEILLDNKKPATALRLAAMRGNKEICDFLVSAGANILSTKHYSGYLSDTNQ